MQSKILLRYVVTYNSASRIIVFAICSDIDLSSCIAKIVSVAGFDINVTSSVFCAYDTRPSSISLHEAVKIGVVFAGGNSFTSYGLFDFLWT